MLIAYARVSKPTAGIVRHGDETDGGRHGQHEHGNERADQPPVAHSGWNVAVQQRRSRHASAEQLKSDATSCGVRFLPKGHTSKRAYAECAARQPSEASCDNSPIQRNCFSTHFHFL